MVRLMFNPDLGIINRALAQFGTSEQGWFGDPDLALDSARVARMQVDVNVPREELERLARGMTPARLAEIPGQLSMLEATSAYSMMRQRKAPATRPMSPMPRTTRCNRLCLARDQGALHLGQRQPPCFEAVSPRAGSARTGPRTIPPCAAEAAPQGKFLLGQNNLACQTPRRRIIS